MDDRGNPLTARERLRYARHLVLPSIGETGQRKLKSARVLVIGLGGLGSPSTLYLAAAGVGTIGIVDDDKVALTNLQRQVLHAEAAIGHSKVDSAARRLADLNPEIVVRGIEERFDAASGARIAEGYDLIVDGTDNFPTRYAINDVCLSRGIPYVYGAVSELEGQTAVLCVDGGPCYRCLVPEASSAEPSGEHAGILGTVPAAIGVLQATEAIKWIVGIGRPLVGRLLIYDAAGARFEEICVAANPRCPACGRSRTTPA